LGRLEWNRRLDAALGALRARLRARETRCCWTRARAQPNASAFGLAGFAPLGVVFELFVEKEELLARGENEFAAAICAG
jgi:hypothetical protein